MEKTKTSLVELQARFVMVGMGNDSRLAVTIEQAQGIWFLCPKCFNEPPRGPIMVHRVICWFRNRKVPTELEPGPGRWNIEGKGIEDLTFVAPGNLSVQLFEGCDAHFFIKEGYAIDY